VRSYNVWYGNGRSQCGHDDPRRVVVCHNDSLIHT
jgi:hypothetical protein